MFLLSSLDRQIINCFKTNILSFLNLNNSSNLFILSIFLYLIASVWSEKHKKKLKREGREIK